ncbi:hypothetical protein BT67DRAFT_431269 [Trichocladium antarcticum]|uniref:Uncharacterized protein n=1 Tax=Trichocladium antarcticum TaxID=1450529 RepID=A0AAN6ZI51_9PEZI|nr:hypothetical protein BT67DRAFT_431269 [Trichocladium antarcticum]
MNGILPTPEFEWEREWRWPWWKFAMHPTDLFTTLHARFNTRICPIQDPGAFIVDVRECIDESPDVETFYAKMDGRKDQRARELEDAWSQVCSLMMSLIIAEPICGDPDCRSREMDEKEPRTTTNDTRWARWAALAHMSRTMAFDNLICFFEGFVRDKRERERREREQLERRLRDKRAAGRNKTPKSLLGDVASTAPAQAPVAASDSSPPFHPALSPVPAPSNEVDEVTAVTPKILDQSNDEKPAPAPATDVAAKTAAPSWRPRSPSPLSALSPSPPRKRRKTDGEEAQPEVPVAETAPSASRKRRRSCGWEWMFRRWDSFDPLYPMPLAEKDLGGVPDEELASPLGQPLGDLEAVNDSRKEAWSTVGTGQPEIEKLFEHYSQAHIALGYDPCCMSELLELENSDTEDERCKRRQREAVRGRLRPVGFCDLAIAIVTITTMLRENPATGGGAASTLGLKEWFGIRRLEFADALVVRQCGCACPAYHHHLRRHGRTDRSHNFMDRAIVRGAQAMSPSI